MSIVFRILCFSLCFMAICSAPLSVEEGSGLIEDTEEITTTAAPRNVYVKLFNWDHTDLADSIFDHMAYNPRPTPEAIEASTPCPDGWIRYKESCYFMQTKLTTFKDAELQCYNKNSTLFVANTMEEWTTIKKESKSYFNWIGLFRAGFYSDNEPAWQAIGGMNVTAMNWAINPYNLPASNGFTQYTRCVALYHNQHAEDTSYAYFHPCTSMYYSICERNSTIINLQAGSPLH